jgi:hypothetical protein
MTKLTNGAELNAHFCYAGFSDYWGGYGCDDNAEHSEHLVYAFYGKNTTLADIVDELVEDAWNGPAGLTLPDDCDTDAVRRAIVEDMLNDLGRADYASGALAECSVAYADANDEEDEDDCDDCCESPIFVVVLEYVKPDEHKGPEDCLGYSKVTHCAACDAYDDCADREDFAN